MEEAESLVEMSVEGSFAARLAVGRPVVRDMSAWVGSVQLVSGTRTKGNVSATYLFVQRYGRGGKPLIEFPRVTFRCVVRWIHEVIALAATSVKDIGGSWRRALVIAPLFYSSR